jgi:hypothetical protein
VTFLDNEKEPNKTRNANPKKSQCIAGPNLQKKTGGPTKGGQPTVEKSQVVASPRLVTRITNT